METVFIARRTKSASTVAVDDGRYWSELVICSSYNADRLDCDGYSYQVQPKNETRPPHHSELVCVQTFNVYQ